MVGGGAEVTRAEARGAAVVVYEQIVQVGGSYAAPDGTVAVRPFGVQTHAQTLGDDAPLHREVVVGIERGTFVGTPGDGAVVDDDVVAETSAEGIGSVGLLGRERPVAHAETHISDDDIAARYRYRIAGHTDSVARRALSGDGQVAARDVQAAVELYRTRYLEKNGNFGEVGYPVSQGARCVGIFERGYIVDRASASARGIASVAVGSREGGNLCLESGCP